jgi:hypothetical protein
MLSSLVPTVDFRRPYTRIHSWKEKKLRCNLSTWICEDSQPLPLFPIQPQLLEYTDEEYETVLKSILI